MKTFIDIPLLVEQLKRFWAIPAISMVVYLLTVVMAVFTMDTTNWSGPDRMMVTVLSMNQPVLIVAAILVPLAAAAALFPYHFSGVADTVFASFPVGKKRLLCTNLLVGTLMFAVPLLVLSLILLIPVYVVSGTTVFGYIHELTGMPMGSRYIQNAPQHIWPGGLLQRQLVNSFPVVAGFFGRSLLSFGFYFALGVLAVSVTGSRVMAALVAFVLSILPVVALALAGSVAGMYVFGFSTVDDFFIDKIMYFVHPVSMGNILNWQMQRLTGGIMWPFYLSYFLIMAGMLTVGCFCCLRRRSERAGDTVVFTPIKNALVFILSLSGMVLGGILFLGMIGTRWGFYIGFAVGFALTYFVAQMIAEKTFHIWHKARKIVPFGAVAAGLYTMMLVFTYGVMYGYVTRVPDMSDVRGVFIWHHGSLHWQQEGRDYIYINDRAVIARTLDAHRQIVDERSGLRRHMWRERAGQWPIAVSDSFPIAYRLNDGRTIYRQYRLPRDFMQASGIEALIRDEAVILSRHPELLNPAMITAINIRPSFAAGPDDTINITNRAQILSLVEALRLDAVASGITERRRHTNEQPWNSHHRETMSVSIGLPGADTWTETWWRYLSLPEYRHTMAWLEDLGY